MTRKSFIISAAAVTLLLAGVACKPTEKNYRQAYEKAQQKARDGLTDEQYEQMMLESLPPYLRTETDSIRYFTENVMWQYSPASVNEGKEVRAAHYNLAIGKYGMLTNAKAHADRLAAEGWQAVVLRNGAPTYFVIAAMSENPDSIADAAHRYRKAYPQGVVALHEPMALIPQGRR